MQQMRKILVMGLVAASTVLAQSELHVGIAPRTAPSDYQAKAVAGEITIAADFVGHAVPTGLNPLTNEDFVAFEAALYGPDGKKMQISWEHFSVRINGKKMPTPSQPVGATLRSLKDPEWVPDEPVGEKAPKGSVNAGAGGQRQPGEPPPPPPKMPFPLRRAMEQKATKVAMPEGERALPVGGLLFFPYRGKDTSIKTIELIYTGPAGTATLTIEQ